MSPRGSVSASSTPWRSRSAFLLRGSYFLHGSAVAQKFEDRRASIYRVRARELTEAAAHEPRDDVHRHMLDQAASFKRIRWRPNQTNNWRGITSPILPKNVD